MDKLWKNYRKSYDFLFKVFMFIIILQVYEICLVKLEEIYEFFCVLVIFIRYDLSLEIFKIQEIYSVNFKIRRVLTIV